MLSLLLSLVVLQTSTPQPRVLRVGPSAEFSSPAAAVAVANVGDTILVGAGVYRGLLLVDRRLALIAEPGAVLDGERKGTVVTVTADSVVIKGFTVRRSGRSLDRDESAIKLVRITGGRVLDNYVSEPLHGIYLLESHGIELAGNWINGDSGLVESRRGNGIHLFNSTNNRLLRNVIRGARDGIYFSFANSNEVTDNEVTGVRYGLHYMYSDDNRFRGNRFTRNAAGAAIMFSKRITFRENTFSEHVGHRAYGILLQTADSVTAERNRFEGNLTGLFLDGSTANAFRENLIAGNGVGIDLLASSEGNTFAGNVITNNRTAVRKLLGAGENNWTENGRGNYWGDPSVFDLDGDGVGDRTHVASDPFASMAGLRPVLEVWVGTPAARALSWADRAFPVFDLPSVEDPTPLVAPPRNAPMPGSTSIRTPSVGLAAVIATFAVAALVVLARDRRRRTARELVAVARS